MDRKKRKKMRAASYLLPPPGGEVVRECLDELDTSREALELLDGKIKLCPRGHRYFADNHEWPCPYCRIKAVEDALRRFTYLGESSDSDPFEIGCYCTSTDTEEIQCAWCLAEDILKGTTEEN